MVSKRKSGISILFTLLFLYIISGVLGHPAVSYAQFQGAPGFPEFPLIPPTANAGPDQTVPAGSTVTLDGGTSNLDPNTCCSLWFWEQIFLPDTPSPSVQLSDIYALQPTFTAPANISVNTVISFSFTVIDYSNLTSTDTVDITVTPSAAPAPPPSTPPTANAGPDQTVEAGSSVTLDGTASSDPDGTIARYSWVELTGLYPNLTITGSDTPTATFIAPSDITNTTVLSFGLTVTDDANLNHTDAADVTIKPPEAPPATPPTPNAGPDQTVEAGSSVTLDGTASSDPDGTIARYDWEELTQNLTITGSDTPTPSFIAPSDISEALPLVFELTVTDNQNLTNTDAVDILVNPQPAEVPPVANAGENQTVSAGQEVTLDGRQSSDQDGTIQSFSWRQIEGPNIPLSNADTPTPSFTAPEVSANSSLVYQLTVTDNNGLMGQDGVIITLTPPLPDADNDGILFEVDTEPNTRSTAFSDQRGGGPTVTNGTIESGSELITIKDVPNEPNKGVNVTAKEGTGSAVIEGCGGTYTINAGDEFTLTCGSAEVEVSKGTIEAEFATRENTRANTELSEGNSLEIDSNENSITAPTSNSQPVEVNVQSPQGTGQITLNPGEVEELAIPTATTPPTATTSPVPQQPSPTQAAPTSPAPGGGGGAAPGGGGGAAPGGGGGAAPGGGGGAAPGGGGGAAPGGGGGQPPSPPKPPSPTARGTPTPPVSPGGTPRPTPFPGGPNQAPTIDIQVPGSVPGARVPVVSPGSLVVMDGSRSKDPNLGDVLKFSWKQEQGGPQRPSGASPGVSPAPTPSPAPSVQLQGADTQKASFIAPRVTKPTPLTFSLTVDDGKGGKNVKSITIGVRPGAANQTRNITLVANAGPDLSVYPNQTVKLDANASTSINPKANLTYLWRQVVAPGEKRITPLNGSTSEVATFKAPSKEGIYTFGLQVTDPQSRQRDVDRMNLTVTAPPPSKTTPKQEGTLFLGLTPSMLYGIIIGAAAAGGGIAALYFLKLRKRPMTTGGEDRYVP